MVTKKGINVCHCCSKNKRSAFRYIVTGQILCYNCEDKYNPTNKTCSIKKVKSGF